MYKSKKVILISGPGGSGKTSLAEKIASENNWIKITEDDIWWDLKKNQEPGTLRTEIEEDYIQNKTYNIIIDKLNSGTNVVLEFILYKNPPKPLIFYREKILEQNIDVKVIILKPDEEEIWKRKLIRKREMEKDEIIERQFAIHQLSCIDSDYIKQNWIINNTNLTLEMTYDLYIKNIIYNKD